MGIGVRADAGAVDCWLLDARGKRIGSGVVQMPELEKGTYLLVLHVPADASPVRCRPALAGVKLPATGPPAEVIQRVPAACPWRARRSRAFGRRAAAGRRFRSTPGRRHRAAAGRDRRSGRRKRAMNRRTRTRCIELLCVAGLGLAGVRTALADSAASGAGRLDAPRRCRRHGDRARPLPAALGPLDRVFHGRHRPRRRRPRRSSRALPASEPRASGRVPVAGRPDPAVPALRAVAVPGAIHAAGGRTPVRPWRR